MHFDAKIDATVSNQSRTNGPINAHLTRYNHNNEKQEALL